VLEHGLIGLSLRPLAAALGTSDRMLLYHFRDKDGAEVDVVLERGGRVAGIEIKAAATVAAADFKGLHKFKDAVGKRFVAGVVLYDGEAIASFGEGLFAVPISMLWEMP